MRSAQSDSTSGPGSEDSFDASSNSNAYNASLKPLKSKPPERQLLDQAGDMLPAEAILEQFDRAHQYVLKNRGEFTAEQQDKLQVCSLLLAACSPMLASQRWCKALVQASLFCLHLLGVALHPKGIDCDDVDRDIHPPSIRCTRHHDRGSELFLH